jgi:hypothetical protein
MTQRSIMIKTRSTLFNRAQIMLDISHFQKIFPYPPIYRQQGLAVDKKTFHNHQRLKEIFKIVHLK